MSFQKKKDSQDVWSGTKVVDTLLSYDFLYLSLIWSVPYFKHCNRFHSHLVCLAPHDQPCIFERGSNLLLDYYSNHYRENLTIVVVILVRRIRCLCFQVFVENHKGCDVEICKELSVASYVSPNTEVLLLFPVLHVLYTHPSLVLRLLLAIDVHFEAAFHSPGCG